MGSGQKQSYYEILDVSMSANSESIRTSYIRAKNAYNRDSLAAYSLFDKDESKRILDEIEEAYNVLSDPEKRRRYDESHGFVTAESVYDSYHRGNHVVAAFTRETMFEDESEPFDDPFRKKPASGSESEPARPHPAVARLESAAQTQPAPVKPIFAVKNIVTDPEMEEKIKSLAGMSGALLKSIREYKQVRAEEMIDHLKISKNYLQALEEDAVTKLPANVFVRGFVIQYAKYLKIDHEKTANAYMDFLKSRRPPTT